VQTVFLSGSLPAGERRARLDALADGRAHIAIGTHALIQETVRFHRLGLVVIDEQHRFGVTQRALLREKGQTPDALVMTATPIPRTLALTTYGDLDVSILDELPPGRKPITTRWISENRRDEAYRLMREEIEKGRQVYVVCPLIEESEKSDLKAAEIIAETLRNAVFSDRKVGLLHGRMKGDEKDGVMQTFKQGGYDILVSTTVIEVGIDVPNATVMVVEHAERFGLAQLHQLRGRVGRGENASFCVLINGLDPGAPIPDDTLARLTIMTETQDGFRIAEEDLRIRGPGEFLGTRQHGLPGLRVADVIKDGELLQMARQAAFHLVEQDPDLSAADHRIVRSILNQNYADLIDWIGVG
jgi:ATP-dependent DNA helicase RecG